MERRVGLFNNPNPFHPKVSQLLNWQVPDLHITAYSCGDSFGFKPNSLLM